MHSLVAQIQSWEDIFDQTTPSILSLAVSFFLAVCGLVNYIFLTLYLGGMGWDINDTRNGVCSRWSIVSVPHDLSDMFLLFCLPTYSLGITYLTRPPLLLPSIEYFCPSVHHLWSGQFYFPKTVYGG